jgi:acyl carrier protein
MNSKEIREKLQDYFRNSILYSESIKEIDGEESLIDGGYIDSTGIIGLVTFLEQAFGIRVYDHEIIPEHFNTLNSIYAYVCGKVENAGSAVRGR